MRILKSAPRVRRRRHPWLYAGERACVQLWTVIEAANKFIETNRQPVQNDAIAASRNPTIGERTKRHHAFAQSHRSRRSMSGEV
ncbi:MAG TPA: hypothetical protein PLP07_09355 [Pyrinomonadaceae bacterium]|nr:hypothetical protein [Chloracidobacterium sp.]HQX56122.1 hypothetical protein [Pyrinomonadaceae bacterium]